MGTRLITLCGVLVGLLVAAIAAVPAEGSTATAKQCKPTVHSNGVPGNGPHNPDQPNGSLPPGEFGAVFANDGQPEAETAADGRYEFTFFWLTPNGTETVRTRAKHLDGSGKSTFELVRGHRSAVVSNLGCWRITGRLGSEKLRIVVDVTAA